MKLSALPQAFRNVNRAREIVTALSRYGLADWISHLNLDFAKGLLRDSEGQSLAGHPRERRIRMALTELGPTFIKLGQLLSTRPDLVGKDLANELRTLQADAPADPPEIVQQTVEDELGETAGESFYQIRSGTARLRVDWANSSSKTAGRQRYSGESSTRRDRPQDQSGSGGDDHASSIGRAAAGI